mgnify:CR=1 FL=1
MEEFRIFKTPLCPEAKGYISKDCKVVAVKVLKLINVWFSEDVGGNKIEKSNQTQTLSKEEESSQIQQEQLASEEMQSIPEIEELYKVQEEYTSPEKEQEVLTGQDQLSQSSLEET